METDGTAWRRFVLQQPSGRRCTGKGGVSVIITPPIFTMDVSCPVPLKHQQARVLSIPSATSCITLHYPSLPSRQPVIAPRNQSRVLSASPAPEMTKGTIHALILEQLVWKPYDLQARQGVWWSNKEAKFESVKQAEIQRWVARTSSGERIIRSNACMHRCISLHVIISLDTKPAGAGAGVGSGAHIPLAHPKPP